ncbi:MAG: DNA repair protein RadA [Chloroflexi bacterium]|nr:DNA repair protein RadA [Chloroflexota bacterium]
MPKASVRFFCQNCGNSQAKWMGRCPECGEWNSLVEVAFAAASNGVASNANPARPIAEIDSGSQQRIAIPIGEFNRVLGGGLVPGSVVLVAGDPGIGKSTLLLQVAGLLGNGERPVLYVSGEESEQQVKMRAERLGISAPQLYLLADTDLERINQQIQTLHPLLAVVDSIQSVRMEGIESSSGSITQVRECANALLHLAKSLGVPIFIVGHVTKSGAIAGPRVLEHIVDTVLYLEGERFHTYRLLRSVKNRFGSTDEVGVFEMRDSGLREVDNPSQVFLEERPSHAPGSTIAVTMEGTRPLMVEVQALASHSALQYPRYTCNGIDLNRLWLLTAVLAKRVGLHLQDQDIFVNVVGGLRLHEPAADLAIALAIASSLQNHPVLADLAVFGEIGLAGELRSVGHIERRLREASKLGFSRAIIPVIRGGSVVSIDHFQVKMVRTAAEAISVALEST